MQSGILKNILIILGLATVAFAGYYMYIQQGTTTLDGTSDAQFQAMLTNTQVFIERRQELDAIDLDTSIFEDRRFTTLITYTQPLEPIQTGRTNPFADIGNGS